MTPPDDAAARGEPRVPLGPVGRYVIKNLTQLRETRRLNYRELSDRLRDVGRPIPTLGLSRIEKGTRRVDVDDLVALALALGVNPSALLLPHGEPGEPFPPPDVIALTSEFDAALTDAWEWADGRAPLPRGEGTIPALFSDFENQARPTWLHRGIVRASELPGMRQQLEDALHRVRLLEEANEISRADRERRLAERPIPVEEALSTIATAIVTSPRGVLVGRRNDGVPPWTFIAGEVEPGETPEFAATREVKEETGLEVRARHEIGRRVHPKTKHPMIYIAAEPVRPGDLEVFVGDADELAEVRWVTLPEADELMAAYGMFGPVHEYLAQEIGEA